MDVASALRAARYAAGLSQKRLARRAGLSAGALSRYESGSALPSLPTFDRLLAACGKDVRMVLTDRVDDLETELARRARLPYRRRIAESAFLRGEFLTRLVAHQADVLVGGSWAAELHGIPTEPAEGRLLLSDDPEVHARTAKAFAAGSVPWRATEGHYGSLSVRAHTFTEHPVAHWTQHDVGRFRTEVLPEAGPWPLEQRLRLPVGPLRVVAAETLTEEDGVAPEVGRAWRAWRDTTGPDPATW